MAVKQVVQAVQKFHVGTGTIRPFRSLVIELGRYNMAAKQAVPAIQKFDDRTGKIQEAVKQVVPAL